MAKCIECGEKIGLFEDSDGGICSACYHASAVQKLEERSATKIKRNTEIEAITLTTETYPEGLNITERIEVITAECAFGMTIFKDLFAGARDIVGGRSEAVQKTLRDSSGTALYELKREAHEVGANAVVGVDLDYVELAAAGNMVLLVASGTGVKVE